MSDSQSTARSPGFLGQAFRQPGFVSCVVLLVLFTIAYRSWIAYAGIRPVKLPIPLRKKLDELDQSKLFPPYKLVHASVIKGEMLDTLGTDQYISWMLRDNSSNGPEQVASLFVTYYTGKPDQVPHVPDVCYAAGGYPPEEAIFREVPIPALGADFTIPVKVLIIKESSLLGRGNRVVMYTFHVNGQFAADRRDVQSVLSNPLDRYAYFSKLEVTFGTQEQLPPRDAAIRAGERLLQVVVPVLLKEHWPDWEAATRAATQPASAPPAPPPVAAAAHS